jgi:hypothetical protein
LPLPKPLADLDAIHPWHLPIEQDKIGGRVGLELLPGFGSIAGCHHLEAPFSQSRFEQQTGRGIIFCD